MAAMNQLWIILLAMLMRLPVWLGVLVGLSLFLNLMQGIYRIHCFIEKRKNPGSEEQIAGDGE